MKYKDVGFRPFYRQFCLLPLNEELRPGLEGFPCEEKANAMLTYCRYDPEYQLVMEIIAGALINDVNVEYFETSLETRACMQLSALKDEDFQLLEDESLAKRYANKIVLLHDDTVSKDVEKTREMTFLDRYRFREYIDIIDVIFYKKRHFC